MVIFSSMHFVSTICWNFNVTLPFDVSCCSNQQLTWICCVGVERKEQSVYYRHLTVSCKIEWHSKCIYVECGRGGGWWGGKTQQNRLLSNIFLEVENCKKTGKWCTRWNNKLCDVTMLMVMVMMITVGAVAPLFRCCVAWGSYVP